MRRVALLALGLCFVLAAPAHAAELRWSAPKTCEDDAPVIARAEQLLGRTLDSVDGIDFDVRIERQAPSRWSLVLTTTPRAEHAGEGAGEARTRELSGTSCDELREAAAVAIAMTVSGRVAERGEEPAAGAEDGTGSEPGPTRDSSAAPPPSAATLASTAAPDTTGETGDDGPHPHDARVS